MKRDNAAPADDEAFAEWALACHQALRDGQLLTPSQSETDPGLRRRQERFQACLRRLARAGQVRSCADTAETVLANAADTAVEQISPTSLGRFRLRRVLGAGGFGVVYLADDPRLGRQVALKVPRPEALLSSELRQRFVREAHTAARLNHPHIVPLFESGESGPFCYLVSAYCAGGSLADWLTRRQGRVSVRVAAELATTLARAVQHAHERGVLHRDLKPGNILLEPLNGQAPGPRQEFDFVPRVGDFGLAKFFGPNPADAAQPGSGPSLTRTQAFLGTPSYMAPEQAASRPSELGPATDVYALGAILYELLTGRPPFQGATPLEILRRVAEDEPTSPVRLRADVPADLAAICLKCLEKKPERRYASAQGLSDDLGRFLTGTPTRARPIGSGARLLKWCRRKPAAAGLIISVCLALTLAAGSVALHLLQQQGHDKTLEVLAREEQERAVETASLKLHTRQAQQRASQEEYSRRFPAIASQWQEGDRQALRPLLKALNPRPGQDDVRGFEWHFLWAQGHQPGAPQALSGHKGRVSAVGFSANGRRVFSAGDGLSNLWDVATGQLERSKRIDSSEARATDQTAFTPDGSRLAVVTDPGASGLRRLQVWDTATGHCIGERRFATTSVWATTISPDGQTAAFSTGSPNAPNDGLVEVRLWNIATGEEQVLWRAASMWVFELRFAPNSRTLAVSRHRVPHAAGRQDFAVDLWDLETRKLQHTLLGHRDVIQTVLFSPDGRILASGSADHGLWLWDAHTGKLLRQIPIGSVVYMFCFSPDGKRIAMYAFSSTGEDSKGTLSVWDVASGQRLPRVLEPGCRITAIEFAPDGKSLAAGGMDGSLRLWEPEEVQPHTDLPGPNGGEAWSLAFSPDGRTLAVGYDDEAGNDRQTLALWDLPTRTVRNILAGHGAMVYGVAFSPDGRSLASACWDETVRLWDPQSGQTRQILPGHRAHVRSVVFSRDGATVVSCGQDSTLHVWDASTGKRRREIASGGIRGSRVAFAADGKALAAALGPDVGVWDMPAGTRRHTFNHAGNVGSVAFAPDGSRLAAGCESGEIRVWDPASGTSAMTLRGHRSGKRGGVLGLAYSPDGKTLASAGEDQSLRLWHAATGAELLCIKDLPAAANDLAFSADGAHLAAALHDGSVRLWHAPPAP